MEHILTACKERKEFIVDALKGTSIASLVLASGAAFGRKRKLATELLEMIGERRITGLLKEQLESDAIELRLEAVSAWRSIGNQQSFSACFEVLKDVSKSVRWAAATALAQMNPEVIAEGLRQAMSHSNDAIRETATEFIGYYATEGVREKLLQLSIDDPSVSVRTTAQIALRKFEQKLHYIDHRVSRASM